MRKSTLNMLVAKIAQKTNQADSRKSAEEKGLSSYLKLDEYNGFLLVSVSLDVTSYNSESNAFNTSNARKTAKEMFEFLTGILAGLEWVANSQQ